MKSPGKTTVVVAVGLVLAIAWFLRGLKTPEAPVRAAGASEASVGSRTAETSPAAPRLSRAPSDKAPEPEPAVPVLDRAKRDQLRNLIWHAIGQPPPDAGAPVRGAAYVFPERPPWRDSPQDGGGSPRIDPKYIRERIHEDFIPLAKKCYEDALERDPKLGGRVLLAFNIVGDAKIGGIVEAADVLNDSTLRDPDVIDCIRQSFLSVTFPPPPDGGTVTVVYPLTFSNDDGG